MTKDVLQSFVESLTDNEKIQILAEREVFERDGSIGDCLLRQSAKNYMKQIGIPETNVVICMVIIAAGIDRYFAKLYLQGAL